MKKCRGTKMNSRKKAGLILSIIGVSLYFFRCVIYTLLSGPIILPLSACLTGTISLLGLILGIKEIKAGGAVILISIPFSTIYISVLNFFLKYSSYTFYDLLLFILWPIPLPMSIFVIIGGMLCLKSSDD